MENEEVTTDVEATPADAEGADNLETHLLEVADSTAEGEAREQAIDEAEDTVEELEADLADAEVAQESGGLSKDAAAILQRNVANKLNRIGLAAPHAVAVESFLVLLLAVLALLAWQWKVSKTVSAVLGKLSLQLSRNPSNG